MGRGRPGGGNPERFRDTKPAVVPALRVGRPRTVIRGARIGRRVLYDRATESRSQRAQATVRKRLLLAGAGEAGLHLLHELRRSDYDVVGFVDDQEELRGRTIGGWRVLGNTHELERIIPDHCVDEVILCMPSAPQAVLQRIVTRCAQLSVKTSSVQADPSEQLCWHVPGPLEIFVSQTSGGSTAPLPQLAEQLLSLLALQPTGQHPSLAVQVLNACGVKDFQAVNVLADQEIREGIKHYANWPTIPQLYVNGEFVGGSDIMREMYQSGELQKLLETEKA